MTTTTVLAGLIGAITWNIATWYVGLPSSSSHALLGGVVGAVFFAAVIGSGAAKRLSAVRWGVAGNMIVAWVLTFPAAACTAGLVYAFMNLFGSGAAGPVIIAGILVVGLAWVFLRRAETAAPAESPA